MYVLLEVICKMNNALGWLAQDKHEKQIGPTRVLAQ